MDNSFTPSTTANSRFTKTVFEGEKKSLRSSSRGKISRMFSPRLDNSKLNITLPKNQFWGSTGFNENNTDRIKSGVLGLNKTGLLSGLGMISGGGVTNR